MRAMKDSGIPWLGQIPEEWEALRLRFVCEFRNGYTPAKDNPEFWTDGTIPWYRMEDIRQRGRKLKEANQYITKEAVKGGGLFEAGSFILATTATIGEHAQLIVDSLANQRFTNLSIRKSLLNTCLRSCYFFYYLFVVDDYCKTTTNSATFAAVNIKDLANFAVAIPPLPEQERIAKYLDGKCAEIDELISVEEQMIAELQAYKQSIITETVTRGLNPAAPLKDSGIPWLGQIPERWETMRAKNMFKKEKREVRESDEIITCFRDGQVTLRRNRRVEGFTEAIAEFGYQGVRKGDLVIHQMDAFAGAIGVSDSDGKGTPVYHCCTPKGNFNVYYYAYLLKEMAQSGFIQSFYRGIRERSSDFKFPIFGVQLLPVPPLPEQERIAEYLDKKCEEIDALVEVKRKKIEELKEYKKSVIYEYVTGKREIA